ncbi:alpha/beta hydrolase [Glaciimonas sp. Gout2]|uniref:alpha/beta fold hydrolase n=1 Tax=unclassified Glaciimonas TaxID=2644401 RepID=UPI002B223353|nr:MULTISPECIES: alpha/beta hydrolase [unclassified Glaciimonas]MEB0013289.1 alpha/beta hydrolase [Glaciimonas sp. Cout2]MEB0082470.1 alpha/beta hydrolase [Glaciimonas sp. Gout2]
MLINVQGHDAYCYTGGKPFDATLPTAVFIHGAQNDHSVWILQTRYFAHHGFSVLAVDLPGHGRSQGAPLTTVESMSDWLLALLKAANVTKALLVGHSMGSLIALETAGRTPSSVLIGGIAMVASAYPMKVSEVLLEAANSDQPTAIAMVNKWSHASFVQKPSNPGPGFYVLGGSQRLMEHIATRDERNVAKATDLPSTENIRSGDTVFYTDFMTCNTYQHGDAAASAIRCPALFLLGKRDAMTPPKAAKTIISNIPHAKVALIDSGHALMAEQPDAVLDELFHFATGIDWLE